ncbi:hypothetical protein RRF57_009186 [Xylaria bambusicola]|uniref:Uncharacterized protein n=1 Tax=Xylaria bambusicola TaxID=326684 RepID=A0AAN7Z8T5_9PEZI
MDPCPLRVQLFEILRDNAILADFKEVRASNSRNKVSYGLLRPIVDLSDKLNRIRRAAEERDSSADTTGSDLAQRMN